MNSLQENKIKPSDFLYGREFYFPQEAAQLLYNIKDIYVENSGGKYKDKDGKKYKRLVSGDYTAVYSKNRLYLSEAAQAEKSSDGTIPNVIITFTDSSNINLMLSALGSYDNEQTFLGQIQKELGGGKESDYGKEFGGERFNLNEFSYKLETIIEGEAGLKIQSSKGFSPFLCMNNYSIKKTTESEISVIYTESGKTLTQFSASSIDQGYTDFYEDFFPADIQHLK